MHVAMFNWKYIENVVIVKLKKKKNWAENSFNFWEVITHNSTSWVINCQTNGLQ